MKRNETKLLTLAFGLIVISTALVMLALSTLSGQAQSEDKSDLFGYPSPTDDIGYPIYWYGYPDPSYPAPIDYGYPVGYPIDTGYPIFEGYTIDEGYPVEVVSEPTEWQAEIEEVKEVIENIQPFEKSRVYQTWKQVKEIVRHYVGKMLMFAR